MKARFASALTVLLIMLTVAFSLKGFAHEHGGRPLLSTSIGVVTTYDLGAGTSLLILSTTVDALENMSKEELTQAKSDVRGVLNGEEPTRLAQAAIKARANDLGPTVTQMTDEEITLSTYEKLSELELASK